MLLNPFHCLTFSLLILPPIVFTTYFFTTFPYSPETLTIHSSLASLPKTSRSWTIYPEDFYDGGSYVNLPYGKVRYWMIGPESGKKVILIHGLSIPAIIWKDVAPELVSQGFRVLLYDLYGRGYTDAPHTTYDASLYATQLALLMQHVQWDQACLAGVSMGGGIATAFTAQFPHLVSDKVALIASAGLIESTDISRTVKLMSSPLVQSFVLLYPFRKYLQHLANSSTAASDPLSEIVRIQSAHLPGYNYAVASSLREGPVRGLASAFQALQKSGRQVLLVHGTVDKTVPYKYARQIQTLVPSSELVTIEGAGHDLTVSHPRQVCEPLVRFFRGEKVL